MDIYEEIVKLRREGRYGAVATIVNARGSIPSFKTAKMLVRDDGSICGTIGGGCVEAEVVNARRIFHECRKLFIAQDSRRASRKGGRRLTYGETGSPYKV